MSSLTWIKRHDKSGKHEDTETGSVVHALEDFE